MLLLGEISTLVLLPLGTTEPPWAQSSKSYNETMSCIRALHIVLDQHISWFLSNNVRLCFSLLLVKVSVLSFSAKEIPRQTVCGALPTCLMDFSHFSDNHHHGTWCLARPVKGHPLPLLSSYSTFFHVGFDLLLKIFWGHIEVLFWLRWLGPAASTAAVATTA